MNVNKLLYNDDGSRKLTNPLELMNRPMPGISSSGASRIIPITEAEVASVLTAAIETSPVNIKKAMDAKITSVKASVANVMSRATTAAIIAITDETIKNFSSKSAIGSRLYSNYQTIKQNMVDTGLFNKVEINCLATLCYLESRVKWNELNRSSGAAGIAGQMMRWYQDSYKSLTDPKNKIGNMILKVMPFQVTEIPPALAKKFVDEAGKVSFALNSAYDLAKSAPVVYMQWKSNVDQVNRLGVKVGDPNFNNPLKWMNNKEVHPHFKMLMNNYASFIQANGIKPLCLFVAWAEGSGLIYGSKFHSNKYQNLHRPDMDIAIYPMVKQYLAGIPPLN